MSSLSTINSEVAGTYHMPLKLVTIGRYAFVNHSITIFDFQSAVFQIDEFAFENATIETIKYGGYSQVNFENISGYNNQAFNDATLELYTGTNYIYFDQNNITWASVIGLNYAYLDNGIETTWLQLNYDEIIDLYYLIIPETFEESTILFARFNLGETIISIENALALTNISEIVFSTIYQLQNWTTVVIL